MYTLNQPHADDNALRDVYSVSRLNREVRALLEGSFPLLWVEGEISNLSRPASGHWYFTLKDEIAQVRCAMFRNRNMHIGFTPKAGMQVLIRARISMYESRGEFQIIAEHMEEAGDGALRRAFEELKQKLHNEGLFDSAHKKPIPVLPRQVGVITSPTGAAIRDILTTLRRRYPGIPVIVYPVAVQGTDSAAQIAAMLKTANARKECDVLILARGGGSLEDLWSFNEEIVARAIYVSEIPVISGVGHEIDFSIADFVADQRAPTPTAAAELVSPDRFELQKRVAHKHVQLIRAMHSQQRSLQVQLGHFTNRLQHPGRRLQDWSQRLDDVQVRLGNAVSHALRHTHARLAHLQTRLHANKPALRLQQSSQQLAYLERRLTNRMLQAIKDNTNAFSNLAHSLDTISPLATLQRGYAITTHEKTGRILRNTDGVEINDTITTRLASGRLICTVNKVDKQ